MTINLAECATFGVAGNFTGHLEQAGEAKDFLNVKTAEVNAPKAIFPTYLPENSSSRLNVVPSFLHTFPFNTSEIVFPAADNKLQIESECAIICDAQWQDDTLVSLKPVLFGASNDCSIRKEGAKKISEKKNWGASSKGLSDNLINIDNFTSDGILNKYRITSYLKRDGVLHQYGEDSAVRDYSYIYEKLLDWMLDKFNNQKCEGPAEDIHSYLTASGKPQQIMISIGATRYTEYGETYFLQNKDISYIVLYPEDKYTAEEIYEKIKSDTLDAEDISVLKQQIIF